jgi:predicted MFS family arabinose efflux permease
MHAMSAGEWRRGWPVVAAGAVGMGVGAALYQYVSSLFIPSLQAAFHWSRGDIASAAAIGLLAAFSAPLIGLLADRFGVRRVAAVCLCAVALAHIGFASMTGELWQFMACVAILSAVGPGCSSLAFSRAVNGWFDGSRGLALGLMACGISIGTLLASPILTWTIAAHGFRAAYFMLAAFAALIGVPVVLACISDGPNTRERATAPLPDAGTLTLALRSASFWLLAAIMFIVNACATGVLTQLSPLLTEKHMTAGVVALLISVFAASVLLGRIAIGWMFDRVEAKFVAAVVTAASAAGALLLLGSTPTIVQTAFAVFLIGLMQGAETDVLAYFVARLFGIHAYNRIYGVLVTISLLGTAAGIVGFGRLYDAAGNYELALTISAGALTLTTALYCFMPSRKKVRA